MFKLILKFQDTVPRGVYIRYNSCHLRQTRNNDVVIDNMAVSGHHAQNRGGRAELLHSGRSRVPKRHLPQSKEDHAGKNF